LDKKIKLTGYSANIGSAKALDRFNPLKYRISNECGILNALASTIDLGAIYSARKPLLS
jgi:hypothetical protein